MNPQKMMLPTHTWSQIRQFIKPIGEGEPVSRLDLGDEYDFLCDLGIIDSINTGELTDVGKTLFESAFIRCDQVEEEKILQELLISFPPTQAILQYLWGVSNITPDQVLTVLKTTDFWIFDDKRLLTHFLNLLNLVKIIKYDRKNRRVVMLINPNILKAPRSIYIDPTMPYGNIFWFKRVLAECEGYIYWFDKHFMKEAFDWIYAISDANKISEVKILSLDLGEGNLNKHAKKDYRRLKDELSKKKISIEWRTIDSDKVRDVHDRWVIGNNDYVRNVPDVNTILSGKRSELVNTDNHDKILSAFMGYWDQGVEVPTL